MERAQEEAKKYFELQKEKAEERKKKKTPKERDLEEAQAIISYNTKCEKLLLQFNDFIRKSGRDT